MYLQARNTDRGTILGERVERAATWWSRFRGLLGRPELREGEGLLLEPCRAVHMIGMRYAIDVVFVDRDRRVVATYVGLAPGRTTRIHRRAVAAIELTTGTLARTGTVTGDLLAWSSLGGEENA